MKLETDLEIGQEVYWYNGIMDKIERGVLQNITIGEGHVTCGIEYKEGSLPVYEDIHSVYKSFNDCQRVIYKNKIEELKDKIKEYEVDLRILGEEESHGKVTISISLHTSCAYNPVAIVYQIPRVLERLGLSKISLEPRAVNVGTRDFECYAEADKNAIPKQEDVDKALKEWDSSTEIDFWEILDE